MALMRIELAKLGRLAGGVPDADLPGLYARMREERQRAAEAARAAREAGAKAAAEAAVVEGLRAALRRHGREVGPDATPLEMRAALADIEREARHDAEEAARLRADLKLERKARELFWAAGCPARAMWDAPEAEAGACPGWVAVRDLLAEQAGYANGFLVALLGSRGTGKTVLATSLIRLCAGCLMSCRYVKAIDLFRDIRRPYVAVAKGKGGEYEDEVVAAWVAPDLLVIDECHQRGETDAEQNALVNLLDRRYDAMACTVLIANQSKAEFAAAIGDSVVSRIHQTGEAIECDWPSFRRPGGWRQAEDARRRVPSGEGTR